MAHLKLLIMGLPGSGKTTLAKRLALRSPMNVVWFDGDATRKIWPDLGFAPADRVEQARRLGALCDLVNSQGYGAIASFVCSAPECRAVFKASYTVWIDRIKEGRFADTNELFVPPPSPNLRLVTGSVDDWVTIVEREIYEAAFYLRATA